MPNERANGEPSSIAVRAYVVADDTEKRGRRITRKLPDPPSTTLIFDTETTTDPAQCLRCGSYQVRRDGGPSEVGIFYEPEALTKNETAILVAYAATHGLTLLTAVEFVEEVFFPAGYDDRASIVGFNLPFDLSRLADQHDSARGSEMKGGFSLRLSPDPHRPRIQVKHLSRRAALIRFTAPARQRATRWQRKRGDWMPVRRGFFVDVKTLAAVHTSQSHSLASLGDFLQTEHRKLDTDDHGKPITPEYIAYALQDVQVTWECFIALKALYERHGLSMTALHHLYSEASLGKAYLKEMGVEPWHATQPDFPPDLIGQIMSTYYGGRAEVHLRRVITQVLYCDFLSMYPTVCTLMGLWRYVIAKEMKWREATAEVRALLERVTLRDLQKKITWRQFAAIVQVQPGRDSFPVRSQYGGEPQHTIGINELTSDRPLWFTLADCIASKLSTGRAPKILRAIAFEPGDSQGGLRSLNIAGDPQYHVEPNTQDFYKRLIEVRSATKAKIPSAKGAEAASLDSKQLALKILANATSYGIFMELNVEELRDPVNAKCFAVDGRAFPVKVDKIEKPGSYFRPMLGTLITGAARLMLAVAERLTLDAGLDWAFCDTDSLAIAKPDGMTDAKFFGKAQAVREWFTPLNPYGQQGPLLKVEDVNCGLDRGSVTKELCPLFCFAVSAKRHALFNIDRRGRPVLRKVSAHGLGHLVAPYAKKGAPRSIPSPVASLRQLGVERWQYDFWYRIVQAALAGDPDHPDFSSLSGFNRPAASRYSATTPHLHRWFKSFNFSKPYAEQVRPFNFLLSFQARHLPDPLWESGDASLVRTHARAKLPHLPRVVAPYHTDPAVAARHCFDRETGRPVRLERLKTYLEVLAQYHLHPEDKFLNGDYLDRGQTQRRHVMVSDIRYIGKEANRWEEQFYLGAVPEAQIEYGNEPKERERALARLQGAVKEHGVTAVARAAGVSRQHVYSVIREDSKPTAVTLAKLIRASQP